MSLSLTPCQQRNASAKTLLEAPKNASPHKPTKLLSSHPKELQHSIAAAKDKSPQRNSPVTSLEKFLASSSRQSKNRVKSPKGVCELRGESANFPSPSKNSKTDSPCKVKKEDPPAILVSEQTTQSPRRLIERRGGAGEDNPEGNRTPLFEHAQHEKSPTCCPATDHTSNTRSDVSPQKPERISDAESLDPKCDNQTLQAPPIQSNLLDDKSDSGLRRSADSIPTKPARTLSKGPKTQNAVFRPKTPQKRFLKKGIKLSPTLIMASISSRAARMKAFAESPKALRNLFVGIVSPKSVEDDDAHSIETPAKSLKTTSFRGIMVPDLRVSASEANDSSSSLKISDLPDPPTRAKQISLHDLLGRSLQHDVNGEDIMDDMFDKDSENTIGTGDHQTPLCYDRWHCSTPCLLSPSFTFQQTSRRRLPCSPTHDSSNSMNNSVSLQSHTSSCSNLFMPNKPRRYNSNECS
jgi:hypothetical protein